MKTKVLSLKTISIVLTALIPIMAQAGVEQKPSQNMPMSRPSGMSGATTVSAATTEFPSAAFAVKKIVARNIWVTAYSSDTDETDDTPFTTASGKAVRVGIVATNLFPFGTKIMIPALFGDNTFIVEDRMHSRKKNNVDIWMPSKREALRFGSVYAEIIVILNEYDLMTKK